MVSNLNPVYTARRFLDLQHIPPIPQSVLLREALLMNYIFSQKRERKKERKRETGRNPSIDTIVDWTGPNA